MHLWAVVVIKPRKLFLEPGLIVDSFQSTFSNYCVYVGFGPDIGPGLSRQFLLVVELGIIAEQIGWPIASG